MGRSPPIAPRAGSYPRAWLPREITQVESMLQRLPSEASVRLKVAATTTLRDNIQVESTSERTLPAVNSRPCPHSVPAPESAMHLREVSDYLWEIPQTGAMRVPGRI